MILPLKEATKEFRRDYVLWVLDMCGGSKRAAAKALGIQRAQLYVVLSKKADILTHSADKLVMETADHG